MHNVITVGRRLSGNSNEPDNVARIIHEISGYETSHDNQNVRVTHDPGDTDWVNQLLELGGYAS